MMLLFDSRDSFRHLFLQCFSFHSHGYSTTFNEFSRHDWTIDLEVEKNKAGIFATNEEKGGRKRS